MISQFQAVIIGKKLEKLGWGKCYDRYTQTLIINSADVAIQLYPSLRYPDATLSDYNTLYADLLSLRNPDDYEEPSYYETLGAILNQAVDKILMLEELERNKQTELYERDEVILKRLLDKVK